MPRASCQTMALVISATFLFTNQQVRADDAPAAGKKSIQTVLDNQVAAWNRSDLAGFMAGYWNSPKLTFSSGNTRLEGWQATFDRYKQRYQSEGREMGKLTFTDLEIEL